MDVGGTKSLASRDEEARVCALSFRGRYGLTATETATTAAISILTQPLTAAHSCMLDATWVSAPPEKRTIIARSGGPRLLAALPPGIPAAGVVFAAWWVSLG
jgi:hypothetical protein